MLSACDALREKVIALVVRDERSPLRGFTPAQVTIDNGMAHLAASQKAKMILFYPACLGTHWIVPIGNPNMLQVIQLDPASGKQIKTFTLPGGSDGMAYDPHRNTLDIASGSGIITLDPKTGSTSTLIDGIGTTDGVAIDRHGNLFIASYIGILELTLDNQLLIVGTDSNGVTWDDVAPLSGSGAANY